MSKMTRKANFRCKIQNLYQREDMTKDSESQLEKFKSSYLRFVAEFMKIS